MQLSFNLKKRCDNLLPQRFAGWLEVFDFVATDRAALKNIKKS